MENYYAAGSAWCRKHHVTFVSADNQGVEFILPNGVKNTHRWKIEDWDVFTPPSDIFIE